MVVWRRKNSKTEIQENSKFLDVVDIEYDDFHYVYQFSGVQEEM